MSREKYPSGAVIIRQGDEGDKFYIIRSGKVNIYRTAEGHEEFLAQLGEGDFFGELALLKQVPRAATVRAIEDVELLTLSKDIFMEIVSKSTSFEEQLRKVYFGR